MKRKINKHDLCNFPIVFLRRAVAADNDEVVGVEDEKVGRTRAHLAQQYC